MTNAKTSHLPHMGTCEVQREMHQAAHMATFFNSSKIDEKVTLELILPNFSGKWAFLLHSIVLP